MSGEDFIKYCRAFDIKSISDKYYKSKGPYCALHSFEIIFTNGDVIEVSSSTDWDIGILEYKLIEHVH